jgi:hypothetical protein
VVGIDNVAGRNMMRGRWGEECDDEDGGYSNTRSMRICMQTIYEKGKEKIKEYATTKVPKATRSLYSVVLCVVLCDHHQACSFVRT